MPGIHPIPITSESLGVGHAQWSFFRATQGIQEAAKKRIRVLKNIKGFQIRTAGEGAIDIALD